MKIQIPDGWHQVSIRTFQELHNAENKLIERMAILIDQDPEFIKTWELASINNVASLLSWSNELPNTETWKRNIVIGDKEYIFNDKLSSLSGGQWLDLEHWLIDPVNNLHKIVGFFYKMDSEVAKEVNIADAYGCLLFFSTIERESIPSIQVYLLEQNLKMMNQLANRKRKGLRRTLKGIKNLLGLRSFTKWRKAAQLK